MRSPIRTLVHTLPLPLRIRLRRRVELYYRDAGAGDTLMAAAVAHEIKQHYGKNIRVSMHGFSQELLANNPDIDLATNTLCGIDCNYHTGAINAGPHLEKNLIETMCRKVGIVPMQPLLPLMYLTDEERASGLSIVNAHDNPVCTIHTTAGPFAAGRKSWPSKNWAILSRLLREENIDTIQLGSASDTFAETDIDLRQELSLRQSIAVMAAARCHAGVVSSLMHGAAAVHTRSVILYGGFERPSAHNYPTVTPIVSKIPCSPCVEADATQAPCPIGVACMTAITPEEVAEKIMEVVYAR